jgi:pyruvate/2-oxoglutarate dehydrogenase complex dihydrolipoamide acyltransferase (E2) component
MSVEILMPELGESVHEGTVSKWLKKVGDYVKEDEPVVEIMTDKVNTELPSPASGYLVKISIDEGDPVEVFNVMGEIEPDQEKAQALIKEGKVGGGEEAEPSTDDKPEPVTDYAGSGQAPEPAEPKEASAEAASTGAGVKFKITPVVKAMMREHDVDERELGQISGSGEGGRVTKKDLEAYLAKRSAAPKKPSAPEPKTTEPKKEKLTPQAPKVEAGPEQEEITLTGLRKMIADHMTESAKVPVVSTLNEVDVTTMVRFRKANKEAFQDQYGVRLTFTPFFIKAVTEALQEFPMVNSLLQGDNKVIINRSVHMGIAVSLGEKGDQGLIVPVIRDTHKKSLVEIAKDLDVIAQKARRNELSVQDVQGGTFTLTNPGTYGGVLGTPMINSPQAGILGTYGIRKELKVQDETFTVRDVMNIVLTYDHRLVDGMVAGRFLQAVKNKLEAFDFFK